MYIVQDLHDITHGQHGNHRYCSSMQEFETNPEHADTPLESAEATAETTVEPPAVTKNRQPSRTLGIVALVVAVVLLGAGQIFVITSQNSTNSQIESLDQQIDDLNSSVGDIAGQVDEIAVSAAAAAATSAAGSATPAPALSAGFLPRFSNQEPDQALGLQLNTVEGPDAYSDAELTIDPADGTKRVWMVWAHWCPYCQQELPELDAWWPEASDTFPNAELVTVTTSMDPSRGNPLESYLESSQFVFPVVVDVDTKIAAQFGVNAFPFWMVTDGDGTVLFRTAGALGMEAIEQLFVQLEEFDA
jgi:cell division protein FtsL/thiol-disulfide isomerase/thioredoxin